MRNVSSQNNQHHTSSFTRYMYTPDSDYFPRANCILFSPTYFIMLCLLCLSY